MRDLLLITAGYLIGSIPWGYIVAKLLRGVDIRTVGSGNLGAANVWRALGFKAGLAVAVLDVGKGFAHVMHQQIGVRRDPDLLAGCVERRLLFGVASAAADLGEDRGTRASRERDRHDPVAALRDVLHHKSTEP